MSDFKSHWLGKFDRESFLKVPSFGHDTNYFNEHLPFNINRQGVFQYLENVIKGKHSEDALSIHQALRYLDDINRPIYRLQVKKNKIKKNNLILSFFLDDIFQPSFLVRKSLEILVEKIKLKKYKNVYLNIEYGAKSLKGKNIEYVHNFFHLYGELIQREPLFIKYSDLMKNCDMSSWDYYEGNLIWYHGDSFLKHFCLSRGSGIIDFTNDESFKGALRIEMSPYYSIEFGYMENMIPNKRVELAMKMGHNFFVEHKDAIREENYLLFNFLHS